jgi:hypothetical protein
LLQFGIERFQIFHRFGINQFPGIRSHHIFQLPPATIGVLTRI